MFRRLGLPIGFLGFPVTDPQPHGDDAREIAGIAGLSMMRSNLSFATAWDPLATAGLPEIWIQNLASWHPSVNRKLSRDIAFARRAGTDTHITLVCSNAAACHALYAAAVTHHQGRARYNRDYFAKLAEVATVTDELQFRCAVASDGELLGFAVLAVNGKTGYYLHGAASASGRRQGISDLLLDSIISAAQNAGCERFTLMASPWDQPGLTAFKRKWGDSEGLVLTYDSGFGILGGIAAMAARWQSRSARSNASQTHGNYRQPLGMP